MIDLTRIRDLVEAGVDRLAFDVRGETIEPDRLSASGPAVMRVDEPTDAVKRVDGDRIVGSVDRETLWAVRWFELDREVVLELGTGTIRPGELIEAVKEAGHRWRVIPAIPSDP